MLLLRRERGTNRAEQVEPDLASRRSAGQDTSSIRATVRPRRGLIRAESGRMVDVPTVSDDVLAAVAAEGAADSGGVPVDLLGDFLDVVVTAVGDGRPITATHLRRYRTLGEQAARRGVALRALLDLYLSAAWRLWRHLPPVVGARRDPDGVVVAGEVMLHAVDDVVAALTEGFQLARRALIRAQESARREFVDDLLAGTAELVGLLHRATGFGLELAGPHAVATATTAEPIDDASPVLATAERVIQGSKGDAHALLASKDGRLVAVFAAPDQAAVDEVVGRLAATLSKARGIGAWRLAVGRAAPGADGVVTSYRESLDALDLAERLGSAEKVLDARDLLVYRLLLHDRVGLGDLVESTLGGLRVARGGPSSMVDTLAAYFAAGGNAAAAARALHLSVRALTYRLDRIEALLHRDPSDPSDRFALQVAVAGARLTGWPTADS